ncbi:MAG: YbhB/YbcL family Raf kinase inhibitor-like protein [Candidatus Marsarchaeota archaeon]|nr:YbhB/YbcL family Raf kinase inhibitor-like protein [Candidatus Marsarchaeota archaeon]MCL5102054.1 YbhB/YbcL family Raf kinase inhibitor-like protein [Candidatus Marsarchaeota archaeon]
MMQITIKGFKNGERIPDQYTCKGIDLQPTVEIEDVPEGTKSVVLIMDDPDAPHGTFTHWIAYNIPPDIHSIEHSRHSEISFGINDFGNEGYNGPCPPHGKSHRYYFRAYATTIEHMQKSLHAKPVIDKLKNSVIETAEYMGTYSND